MPKAADLPNSLTEFAFRNAAEVNAGCECNQQIDRVIRQMDKILSEIKGDSAFRGNGT
jgi:hypothetical protein